MKIYLGGPINGCTDEEANGWRDAVKAAAPQHEYVDPMRRDYRGREMEVGVADKIVAGDIADIDSCDLLIFNCPKPSYGTAMEIFYGASSGKLVVTVLPDDGRDPSPWLVVHSNKIVRGAAVDAIKEVV